MGEYADSIRSRAVAALVSMAREAPPRDCDPILLLISHLLEEGTDDCPAEPREFVTVDDWMLWNRLVATRPRLVRAAITATLEWERPILPRETMKMQVWGARLVLSTLDRLALR